VLDTKFHVALCYAIFRGGYTPCEIGQIYIKSGNMVRKSGKSGENY